MTDSGNRKVAALVGAGMVAGTHVAACAAAVSMLQLKGVLSRGEERAQKLAEQASESTGEKVIVYRSVDELAADPDIDFAVVVTPPNVREELIAPLVAAGKHILLEKPIGRNYMEAKEIVRLCDQANVSLGVVFQHRMRAASIKARDLIQTGELGNLGLVDISVPWWRDQSYYDEPGRGTYGRDGGGVLISQAIHTIDLALSFSGPVKSVLAMAKTSRFHKMESEDFVVAGLEFLSGAVGSMVASTASFPGGTESITLHFDKASLHLEAGQLRVSWRDGREDTYGEEAATGGGADPMAFTHEWHQAVLENFVGSLNGEAHRTIISGKDALNAHAFIDATVGSAASGCKHYPDT